MRGARLGPAAASPVLPLNPLALCGACLLLPLTACLLRRCCRYRQTEEHDEAAVADQAAILTAGATGEAGKQQQGGAADGTEQCHTEEHAEYDGETVVQWGDKNYKESAAACCAACQAATQGAKRCNVWVYCSAADGCGTGRAHRECWLKHSKGLDPTKPSGRRGPGARLLRGGVYA